MKEIEKKNVIPSLSLISDNNKTKTKRNKRVINGIMKMRHVQICLWYKINRKKRSEVTTEKWTDKYKKVHNEFMTYQLMNT